MKRKYVIPNLWTVELATEDVLKVSAQSMEGATWGGSGFYFEDFFE